MTDIAGLVERLKAGRSVLPLHEFDFVWRPNNPDGEEAASAIEALEAKLRGAVEVLKELMATHDEDIDLDDHDDNDCVGWFENGDLIPLTFGTLRRARAFLASMEPPK